MTGDALIRAQAEKADVPQMGKPPFVGPLDLRGARVAIVTTAALHQDEQPQFGLFDTSFRVLDATKPLTLGHGSPNFDRTGWITDPNVVFPIDRLSEMAAEGAIGDAAARHISFAGSLRTNLLKTVELDSGPAAAAVLRADGVDVVLITPI